MTTQRQPPNVSERLVLIDRTTGEVVFGMRRYLLLDRFSWDVLAWYGSYEHALAAQRQETNRATRIGVVLTEDNL